MDYVLAAIVIFMVYIAVYSIVNRICNCVEHCSTAKAVGATMSKADKNTLKELNKTIQQEG